MLSLPGDSVGEDVRCCHCRVLTLQKMSEFVLTGSSSFEERQTFKCQMMSRRSVRQSITTASEFVTVELEDMSRASDLVTARTSLACKDITEHESIPIFKQTSFA